MLLCCFFWSSFRSLSLKSLLFNRKINAYEKRHLSPQVIVPPAQVLSLTSSSLTISYFSPSSLFLQLPYSVPCSARVLSPLQLELSFFFFLNTFLLKYGQFPMLCQSPVHSTALQSQRNTHTFIITFFFSVGYRKMELHS